MKRLAFRKYLAWLDRIVLCFEAFDPYLAIALQRPGGSFVALLIWLHRRIQR